MPQRPYEIQQLAVGRMNAADAHGRRSRLGFQDAIGRLEGFDPSQFMRQQAGSMFNRLSERFQGMHAQRNAMNNRRGLFQSGIGEAGIQRDFSSRLSDALSGLSMQGAQMRQQAMTAGAGMRGDMHRSDVDQAGRYFDANAGLGMSIYQQQLADKASKRSMWGQIGGGLLTGAGLALSDERLKKNVKKEKGALKKIGALKGVEWEWKGLAKSLVGDQGTKGVIAQDVEKVAPGLVTNHPSGYKQVDYTGLMGLLVEGVKELDRRTK